MSGDARTSREPPGGWLERTADFFIAPAADPAPARATLPPAARAVALGTPGDACAAAAAVALGLGARAALVAHWRGHPPPRGLATRAAAQLAARVGADEASIRVGADEASTHARGRLAWLSLPDDPIAAAGAVRGASALVAGPFVTALAGARPPELETLIAEHDIAVVVADPESSLARAALAALAARGVPAIALPPLPRGLARTLALAGISAPRRSVFAPMEVAP
jgi:hypothetical protein